MSSKGYHSNRRGYRPHDKVEGLRWQYFSLHNLLSMLFFFQVALFLGLFENQARDFMAIASIDFLIFLGQILFLSMTCALLGRGVAYILLYFYYDYFREKQIKSFSDLNTGVNSVNYGWFIASLIGATLFAVGAVYILDRMLFNQSTMWTLVLTYILIKALVYIYVWAKYK